MTASTRTLTIGELTLRIMGSDLAAQLVDKPYAAEFEVEVEYRYSPFEPATHDEEAIPAELTIKAVRATANVHFEGDGWSVTAMRGTDLTELFSGAQLTALEDRILVEIESEAKNDA